MVCDLLLLLLSCSRQIHQLPCQCVAVACEVDAALEVVGPLDGVPGAVSDVDRSLENEFTIDDTKILVVAGSGGCIFIIIGVGIIIIVVRTSIWSAAQVGDEVKRRCRSDGCEDLKPIRRCETDKSANIEEEE